MKPLHISDFDDFYTVAIELLERKAEILALRAELYAIRFGWFWEGVECK